MQNAAGNNALTTVRQTSQTSAYYQLRQSGSDTQYFFWKRSDEASYEINLIRTIMNCFYRFLCEAPYLDVFSRF